MGVRRTVAHRAPESRCTLDREGVSDPAGETSAPSFPDRQERDLAGARILGRRHAPFLTHATGREHGHLITSPLSFPC
jgi:hypothetical protein